MAQETKKYMVRVYPYAEQEGEIEVPASLTREEIRDYIYGEFSKIKLSEVNLSYKGADFDFWEEE